MSGDGRCGGDEAELQKEVKDKKTNGASLKMAHLEDYCKQR